jgi:hypothetical protein
MTVGCGTSYNPAYSVFAGMSTAAKQALLTQAQTAYGDLLTGGKPVSVSYGQGDGVRTVTYSAATSAGLANLISQLQVELGIKTRGRRPIRFAF